MDIVVIGGGIVGASTAYHIGSQSDHSVVVLDRGDLGGETSAWSVASFKMQGDQADHAMRREALALYNDFLESPRADPWYDIVGELVVATTQERATDLRAAADDTGSDPLSGATYLDGPDIDRQVLTPALRTEDIVAGLYRPNAAFFDPAELTREFIARAREVGTEFSPQTAVTTIHTDDDGVTAVETAERRLPADEVVCAAGPWTAGLARSVGVDLPVRHTVAYAVDVDLGRPKTRVLPKINHRETGAGFRGDRGSTDMLYRTGPTGNPAAYYEEARERDPDDIDTDPDAIHAALLDALDPIMPSLSEATFGDGRVGLLSRTPDTHPIVGQIGPPGFSVAALHAEGIQLAPAIGRTIAADLLEQSAPSYADAISPDRFSGGGHSSKNPGRWG